MRDSAIYGLMRAQQATGKRFPALERELAKLSPEAAQDIHRLIDELLQHKMEKRRAARQPWRHF